MESWKRSHHCGELTKRDVGKRVVLNGWVDVVRDLGGLTFIDLRDREGITQVLVRPQSGDTLVADAKKVGTEWVIAVEGEVLERSSETVNPNLLTGEVEVSATDIQILSRSKTPPFEIDDKTRANEDLRLKYRYLDLRRSSMRNNLRIRSKLAFAARQYMNSIGFVDVETPFLTRSTPEGARDYLVPSRVHQGSFYALPQSPQLFKQLLMVSGLERYYQIVRCFRDEDLRADRQPEFTQIDIEMSFVDRDQVMETVEGLFAAMLSEIGVELELPLLRLSYDEAMDRYGSDKPDLRFGCELFDLTDIVQGSGYGVFDNAIESGGAVRALIAKGCASYSRKDIDLLEAYLKELGGRGLGWARWTDSELKSPMTKHLGESRLKDAFQHCGGKPGDLMLVVAGERRRCSELLGALRLRLADQQGWIDKAPSVWKMLWVTDFPLFDYSEAEARFQAMHHPFTSPNQADLDRLETDPGSVRSLAYDLVANGHEVGGGSIRIHDHDIQKRVFKALSLTDEQATGKFGFFLEALQYGTPPHGGIALGFDRIAMLAIGGTSLRDVIAFPKTTSAFDLMTRSPSEVTSQQLDELGIQTKTDE